MTMLPTAPVAVGGETIEQEDHLTVSDITMPSAAEVDDPEDPMDGTILSRSVGLGRPGPNLPASENRKPGASPAGNGIPSVETSPANDPLSTQHKWTIENFSKITARKKYSEPFEIGLHKWRLLIFPKGNQTENLAIYLDVAEASELPPGWSREAEFCLSLVNQRDPTLTVKKDTSHKFSSKECDWGFTSFMPLGDLYEQGNGFLVKDTVIIEARVSIRQDYWAWDSKKATGYVGLKNQGATCYMNSLLQTLYHIPYFRKAVYHMPTTENDEAATSLAVALQSLFYKLQYSDTSVSTKDLTKSFGWDAFDSFMQHDVQELNRVLCEKLEDKMKGTSVEGTIEQLFEGHHMNTIECINVEYKSDRKESFYDLQLDVKGCADVYASFDKYTEVEELVGDNKYAAEQHGLQDARKGVSFLDFPPVLQLQLKRFEYDFIRDTMVKINDRYAFPLHLDLEREGGRYLAPGADRSVANCYTLHSVLVHSGGVHGGHYYAYIAPALDHRWFKFDDERVTGEDAHRALDEQYGGGEELKFTNHSNAYMLVYVRDADRDTILCPVDSSDIAEHLEVRLKREQEEKERKKKEKAEAHLYTVIKVATDADLKEQIGRTLYFDLVDHDRVRSFRVPKQTTFAAFKEEVALELKVALPAQRFWAMAKRKNHTFRPSQPLTPAQEAMHVGAVKEGTAAEVRLYLEGEPWRKRGKNEVLLFCKLYDPLHQTLAYAGKLSVSLACKPSDLVDQLCALAGYASGTQLLLFEEVRSEPVMCERMDMEVALKASSMEDGDILCFQRHLGAEEAQAVRYPCVDAFLLYVRYRQVVHFRRLEKPGEEVVTLELSMRNTYDEVTEQLAQKLGLADPTLLRLTLHNCYSCVPRPPALKYRGVERLESMLVHYNQTADIVYFEVLTLPLPDLERLKTLNLAFHNLRGEEVGTHSLRLPKTSTVGDVLKEVRGRVEVSHPEAQLRLLEIFDHKIYKIFPTSDPIENINDHYWRLRAEEIPVDQQQSDHRLLHVYHFSKEGNTVVHNFGDPLLLTLSATESVGELKGRIQRKLGVAEEEFAQWGVALVSLGHADYLKDDDLLAPRLPKKDTCGAWEHYLGLEHTDTAPRRHHHTQHRQGYGYEKAVKIYN